MNFAIKTLEFNRILQIITKYAYTNTTKQRLLEVIPSSNYFDVEKDLLLTDQMTILIAKYGSLPFIEDFDIDDLLGDTKTANYLSIKEILQIKLFIKMVNDLINYKRHIKDYKDYPLLMELFDLLIPLDSLLNEINNVIDYDGYILDDASIILKDIRTNLKKTYDKRSKLSQTLIIKYQNYLAEMQFVTRNNRLTLAVKDTFKNKVSGIIHDVSQTNKTIFIEPQEIVEKTIEIDYLLAQEKNEIIFILQSLTKLIKNSLSELLTNLELAIKLDFISSKAKYALSINAVLPNINNEGIVDLINAKHPLIPMDEVVPISFKLDNDSRSMFITGPNTGGKTVAIKTCGILTLMVQSGILVPTSSHSNFNIFDNVFADIGDEQSIDQSLSTFSSHMKKIISMVNNVTNNSLILLDELGSGTDPDQGVSLAMAIINYFNNYNVRLLLTTHYAELKQFAYEKKDILLASVAFDKETLKPLYYLNVGISGQSHALEIVERLGLKQEIINDANQIYFNYESDLSKIIDKLNTEKELLVTKQNELFQKEISLNETYNKYQSKLEELEKNKEKIIKDLTLKTNKKHEALLYEANLILENLKNKDSISIPDYAKIKQKLNVPVDEKQLPTNQTLKVNDYVFIKSFEQYGTIISILKNKYLVKFGHFEMEFNKNDLRKETKLAEKKQLRPNRVLKEETTPKSNISSFEVDLRGYRYEEVSYKLDEAIDQAILARFNNLYIIHGYGTGAIKGAVTKYLKKSSHVKSYRPGTHEEGYHGVTVVELK